MNTSDRRRVVFATVFTVVALPALWVSGRDQAQTTTAPSAGAVGLETRTAGDVHATTVTTTYQPASPVFLGNADGGATADPPAIAIEHRTDPVGNFAEVRASFRRYQSSDSCTTPYAGGGVRITVTNTDNGQSLTCRNVLGPAVPPGDGILVDTDLLAHIANLADAPISVRISW